MGRIAQAQDIVAFWKEAGPERWFRGGAEFDARCVDACLTTWEAARDGELDHWATTPLGALALVILLDQMPRNMFRGTARAYETDAKARDVAAAAIGAGHDHTVDSNLRRFFYLPFMHAENLADQDRSVALNEALGDPDSLKWARHHRDIVARFGRFPHRNAMLGRASTPEEIEWMAREDAFKG